MFTKYSNFVLTFGHVAKRLDSKEKLILKFMTSQSGKQVIAINILPNILRSKDKETMKFGQLIKYNLRNIFNVVEKQLNSLQLTSHKIVDIILVSS